MGWGLLLPQAVVYVADTARILSCCGVGWWLCCRPAAVALILPLVWELPYAMGVALTNKQTNQKKTQKTTMQVGYLRYFLPW